MIEKRETGKESNCWLTNIKNWKWFNIQRTSTCNVTFLIIRYSDERYNIANSMLNMLTAQSFPLFLLSISLKRLFVPHLLHSDYAAPNSALTHSLTQFILIYWSVLVQVLFNECLPFLRFCILFILLFLLLFRFFHSCYLIILYKSKVGMQDNVIYVVHIFMSFAISFGSCQWSLFERRKNQNEVKIPIHNGMNFLL